MNRAEKRRQQKLAKKNAKNSKSAFGQKNLEIDNQVLTVQQALGLAIQHHSSGRLTQAGSIYQQILNADANQPDALHFLGLLTHQTGKSDEGVGLIKRAIALKTDYADAHYNLGNIFKDTDDLDNAIDSFRKAITHKPDYTDAYYNLGNALNEQQQFDEAIEHFQKAIALKPNHAEAHNNLGVAYNELGQFDEAVSCYLKAQEIKPDYIDAYYNVGNILHTQGKLEEAISVYQKALTINPDYAAVQNNLGLAYQKVGEMENAFSCHRRATSLDPDNDSYWTGMARAMETLSFTSSDKSLEQDISRLLERPTGDFSYINRPIISLLKLQTQFSQTLRDAEEGKLVSEVSDVNVTTQLSSIPLFLQIMRLSPINDLDIERMLTSLRLIQLQKTMAETVAETDTLFPVALASQCFINEYVYFETDAEKLLIKGLEQRIAVLAEQDQDVPPILICTLGAYRPLYQFPWAKDLSRRTWTGPITNVIKQQISEPLIEQTLRSKILHLTSIQDAVSQSVRDQYEENPYPRWIKPQLNDKSGSIAAVLRTTLLGIDLDNYVSPKNPKVLVAGCGTGQHALGTATRFLEAQTLAVDLSMSSLSYAMRKTEELGVTNIEYGQADIMELSALDRRFDLIECSGVLHHMRDPLAGWRVLVDLLKADGLMKIALYSETARQDIVAGRTLISELEYSATPDDIRQCRQDIIAKADNGNSNMAKICSGRDFFSLSNLRDLLFHVQEHRFTIPQIEAAIKDLGLKFLGFEIRDHRALRKFTQLYPDKSDLISLPLWHDFELKNPDTFRGMYQLWCQKA